MQAQPPAGIADERRADRIGPENFLSRNQDAFPDFGNDVQLLPLSEMHLPVYMPWTDA